MTQIQRPIRPAIVATRTEQTARIHVQNRRLTARNVNVVPRVGTARRIRGQLTIVPQIKHPRIIPPDIHPVIPGDGGVGDVGHQTVKAQRPAGTEVIPIGDIEHADIGVDALKNRVAVPNAAGTATQIKRRIGPHQHRGPALFDRHRNRRSHPVGHQHNISAGRSQRQRIRANERIAARIRKGHGCRGNHRIQIDRVSPRRPAARTNDRSIRRTASPIPSVATRPVPPVRVRTRTVRKPIPAPIIGPNQRRLPIPYLRRRRYSINHSRNDYRQDNTQTPTKSNR